MTPDLGRLKAAFDSLGAVVEQLELELVDDANWAEPSDTSYLNDNDCSNPDIMANVEAMAAVNKLIAWFGKDQEGFVGLWRGASARPLTESPVVRLDTEGQYAIVAATIPDYLAISVPDEDFVTARSLLVGSGFSVGNNPDAIWAALDAFTDDPNDHRNTLYEQARAQRGIGRSDEEPTLPFPDAEPAPAEEPAAPAAKPAATKQPVKAAPKKSAKPAAKKSAKPAAKKSAKPAAKKPAKAAAKKSAKKPSKKPAKKAAKAAATKPAKAAAKKTAKKPAKKAAKKTKKKR